MRGARSRRGKSNTTLRQRARTHQSAFPGVVRGPADRVSAHPTGKTEARPHSSLGYRTPQEFATAMRAAEAGSALLATHIRGGVRSLACCTTRGCPGNIHIREGGLYSVLSQAAIGSGYNLVSDLRWTS